MPTLGKTVCSIAAVISLAALSTAQENAAVNRSMKLPMADVTDGMTAMGRLAYTVAKAREKQPNFGIGRSFRASLGGVRAGAGDPDICISGDEDCSEQGFTEGPGGGQAEVSIAIDVTGQHIVVGYNDTRGFATNPASLSGFVFSDDGGNTFSAGGLLPVTSNGGLSNGTLLPQVFGDPVLVYIPGGAGCQFVYASIGVIGYSGTAPNFTGTAQTMVVHRSTDCGHTWTGPFEVTAATNPTGVKTGNNARDAADKEFMDVDPDTGRVMISWSNFTSGTVIPGGVQIRTTFSDNILTGNPPTWSSGVVVNPGSITFDTGSVPRFAGNGSTKAYVAYSNASRTVFASNVSVAVSNDNGATWGAPQKLSAADFFTADYILGDDRIHSFPTMAVDNSNGANKGNIYVAASTNDNGDGADVQMWRSTNNGATFSAGLLLNSRPANDRSQWFPYITVDSTTGRVGLLFDDEGVAASGDGMQMSWMSSTDGGATWSKPSALTRPFHAGYGNDTGQPNIGDYNGAVAQNGTFYAAFANVAVVPLFTDGQPTSQFPYPTFIPSGSGAEAYSGFAKVTAPQASVDLGVPAFTESGGNGFMDAGDQVKLTVPLRNFVTNPNASAATYTSVSATLASSTPGVSFLRASSAYPDIAAGGTQNNTQQFVFTIAPGFTPGTKIDFTLSVTTNNGTAILPFLMNTGTPVNTTVFSENFNGVAPGALPAGWGTIHAGGGNTVPWTTNNTFCGTSSNGLFHQNANDGPSANVNTRFERATSPNINIPNNSQYVTVDFDVCYDTEDDPNFNVLAYDGADLRITDFTPGHFARAAFVEAYAETFTTGSFAHYPKHAPRSNNGNYFQDISMWAGDSGGFKHVNMRIDGMAGTIIQLRPDFTQDFAGICTDVRPTHTTCGVIMDNFVVNSVVTKSDELAKITLRPVPGTPGQWTGTVTSQPIAPAGGITVTLTSSLPALTTITPSTVVIPAGSQTSPSFTVTLDPAAAGIPVTITATGPSNTRSAGIQR